MEDLEAADYYAPLLLPLVCQVGVDGCKTDMQTVGERTAAAIALR